MQGVLDRINDYDVIDNKWHHKSWRKFEIVPKDTVDFIVMSYVKLHPPTVSHTKIFTNSHWYITFIVHFEILHLHIQSNIQSIHQQWQFWQCLFHVLVSF